MLLVDACNACYSSGLVFETCLLLLVGFAASQWLTEYARTVIPLLLLTEYTCFTNAQFFSHVGNNRLLCLPQTRAL